MVPQSTVISYYHQTSGLCVSCNVLGDAFERAYGDLRFTPLDEEQIHHWYFMAHTSTTDYCYGVKVQPNAFCAWTLTPTTMTLWLDVRNGTDALYLTNRSLECCQIVTAEYQTTNPLTNLTQFCHQLSIEVPQTNDEKFIVTNDWYYAYGNNNRQDVLANTRGIVELTAQLPIQPWAVIDDGWQQDHSSNYNGGPLNAGNQKFGSMQEVAS